MTFLEAAIEILRHADEPLHFAEVARRAVEENLLSHVGRDPEAAMRSCLNSAVRGRGDGDPIIIREKPGYYGIRPGAPLPEPPPRPQPSTKKTRTKKSSDSEESSGKAKADSRAKRKTSSSKTQSKKTTKTKAKTSKARASSSSTGRKRAKGEAPAPETVEVLPMRKTTEKRAAKADAPSAEDSAEAQLEIRGVEFEAPSGSGLEGVTDVALVMANAMSRLVEERPELKDDFEAMQQQRQAEAAKREQQAKEERSASSGNGNGGRSSRAASSSGASASDERSGRRRRRRRRRGKRVDWTGETDDRGQSVGDKLLDGVAKVLADSGNRSLHVRQIAETLASKGVLGGEISEIERAVTAAILMDIQRYDRASRFAARGDARYQLQGARLPERAAKAEQAFREALLTVEHETHAQLIGWLQSLGARALESLVRIWLTRESFQLMAALPPGRGVGKLVVDDPESEEDNSRTLVVVIPKRTPVEAKLWEGELERNNCASLQLFAMGDTPDDVASDARVIGAEELAQWLLHHRIGVGSVRVEVPVLDATFIESVAGLDT